MAHQFGLLFKPIAVEGAAFPELIGVAAEGMPHQDEVEAPARLGLPDMGHLMDEQALQRQPFFRKIFRPEVGIGMEVNIARRRHDDSARLERPPFAADELYAIVVDGIAEDRTGEGDFTGSERAGAFHRLLS